MMERRGRKPAGPALVERLEGSASAKNRLQVILETITGNTTILQACERLGISEAMFHKLRAGVLQTALGRLEPRSAGRPRQETGPEQLQVQLLQSQVEDLQIDLQAAQIRLEIAQAMPHLRRRDETPPLKKTTPAISPAAARRLERSRRRRRESI